MKWDVYAQAHHCYSYFNSLDTKLPSTFHEMTVVEPVSKNQLT